MTTDWGTPVITGAVLKMDNTRVNAQKSFIVTSYLWSINVPV